jgi:hypothetical protein
MYLIVVVGLMFVLPIACTMGEVLIGNVLFSLVVVGTNRRWRRLTMLYENPPVAVDAFRDSKERDREASVSGLSALL